MNEEGDPVSDDEQPGRTSARQTVETIPSARIVARFLSRFRGRSKAQSLVETALILPILMLLIAGVADIGRAFYYKIAATNVAREAAHWATVLDRNTSQPPTDNEIQVDVAQPSQESFGLNLGLAPLCSVGVQSDTNCPGNGSNGKTIRHAVPPIPTSILATSPMSTQLQPGQSWLFLYPDVADRTALAPSRQDVAWHEIGYSSRIVYAQDPAHGGLASVIKQIQQGIGPVTAEAASTGFCYGFAAPQIQPSSVTIDPGGTFSIGVAVPVTGSSSNPANNINVTAAVTNVVPAVGTTFSQLWSPSNGSDTTESLLTLTQDTSNYTVNGTSQMLLDTSGHAGATVTVTVTASSVLQSGFTGCSNAAPANQTSTMTVFINAPPSPSPGTSSPDFSLGVNPVVINVPQGSSAATTLFSDVVGGFSNSVTLAVTTPDSPTLLLGGLSANFSKNPIPSPGNGTSTLTISATSGAPLATYNFVITGTGGASTHSVNLTVNVVGPLPSPGPSAAPTTGPGPKAHLITATVIYYMTPITPGLFFIFPDSAIYIVGSATLEATY